jgi:hypothetical protein
MAVGGGRSRAEEVGGKAASTVAVEPGAIGAGVVTSAGAVAMAWCRGRTGRLGVRRASDGAEEGAGGTAGEGAFGGGFAEGAAVLGEDGEGEVLGLGSGVGGAAEGEFIRRVEEGADGRLGAPDEELAEREFVGGGDVDEVAVGLEEVVEELVWVDGEAVDLGVDGLGEGVVGGGGEHEGKVPRGQAGARGRMDLE